MSRFSVVVPVFNAGETLGACLEAVCDQARPGDEVIVVDDGSTDDSADIASRYPVQLIRNPENLGVTASRNHAAAVSTGDLLLFTDADATLSPGTLERARSLLTAPDAPSAVVGVYAASGGPDNAVSRFKNLWIRYSYLRSPRRIDWLFGCIFALRRELFLEIGGFDGRFLRDTGGGDIDLGMRLHRAGGEIRLDPDLQVVHLRRFTLKGLYRNDRNRSGGYSRLGLRSHGWRRLLQRLRFANIGAGFLIGMALLPLAALAAAGAAAGLVPPWAAVVAGGLYLALNLRFYGYLARHGGAALALAGVGLLAVSQAACCTGSARGVLERLRTALAPAAGRASGDPGRPSR